MGTSWSLSGTKSETNGYKDLSSCKTSKRQKMSSSIWNEESLQLIPNLPDEISIQIFARLPRICYFSMRLVARNWKGVFSSPELFRLRKELGTTEEWLFLLTKAEEDELIWHAIDPWSKQWLKLPAIPNVVHPEEPLKGFHRLQVWNMVGQSNIIDKIRGWLGHKHVREQPPFCGCAIGTLDGRLYVLGGFTRASAMKCVWRYDPVLNKWSEITPMSTGRAYSKTSILNNKLYVVGGVNRAEGGSGLAPLQSGEVFDPCTGTWSELPSMPFSKAQVVPAAFLSDMLKPIATGMTPYRGKLCVPQSLYSWPFFVDVGGEIFDPKTNSWDEMPNGMGEGWPARQAGTKLSVVVDDELYALDPSSSLNSGKIKVYDKEEDAWKVVIPKVPICDFSESESPYLLACLERKLHVITKDANRNVVVLQADIRSSGGENLTPSSSWTTSTGTSDGQTQFIEGSERVVWKVMSVTDFGSAELVNCQVLNF